MKTATIQKIIEGLFVMFAFAILMVIEPVKAEGFDYDGSTEFKSADKEMEIHACLSFVVFMESRGDENADHKLISMVAINRANNRSWSNDVCDIFTEESQFEPIGKVEREVISKIKHGEVFAGLEYVEQHFNTYADMKAYRKIEEITYRVLYLNRDSKDWVHALYFYSPGSLARRGLPTPSWIKKCTTVARTKEHIYLM